MTALKIDLEKFKQACEESRDHMSNYDCVSSNQHRMSVQWNCEIDWMNAPEEPEPEFTTEDFRAALRVASKAKQQFGATDGQINYYAKLCEEAGKISYRNTPQTLTKFEASMMIEHLEKELGKADSDESVVE